LYYKIAFREGLWRESKSNIDLYRRYAVIVEPTATVATVDQATPVATTAVAATPVAGTTGDVNECRPFQLTSYLAYEVVGADGEEIGEVDGVVVYRDAALVPAAGAPDFTGFTAGQYANPTVAYLVVDFDDAAGFGDAETLIPFGAFEALNEQTAFEDCRLVFANSYELDGFPLWDWDAQPDLNEENWDDEWAGFWSNLGVNVTTTAPSGQQIGNPVIFRDNFDDINVLNLQGEDLGEIEEFILDPATGEITHAVLATGGFLGIGEKWIPIPMNQVIWGNYDEENNDLGEIYINHPDDYWSEAPVIDDLDGVDFSLDTWDDEYDLYWEGVNTRTTP
jgi:sporulation protein YlmC with PRC-barrel domain